MSQIIQPAPTVYTELAYTELFGPAVPFSAVQTSVGLTVVVDLLDTHNYEIEAWVPSFSSPSADQWVGMIVESIAPSPLVQAWTQASSYADASTGIGSGVTAKRVLRAAGFTSGQYTFNVLALVISGGGTCNFDSLSFQRAFLQVMDRGLA